MTQLLVFISVISFLIGNTVADILVQPGYGQPTSSQLSHPIVQPLSTLSQVPNLEQVQPHRPGYHLELHPVYGHLGQSHGGLGYLQGHDLSPYTSRPGYRRLHYGKLGGPGFYGPHGIIPPRIPVPVRHRFRRSTGEQPIAERERRNSDAMAAKSTLNGDNPTIVDLLNQDTEEKHMKVRHSNNAQAVSSSTLLGLNPSNMYSAQNQYTFAMPTYVPYQELVNEHPEIASQMNVQPRLQEHATLQNRVTISTENKIPEIIPVGLQPVIAPQQVNLRSETSQTVVQRQHRNFPDPRPLATVQSLTKVQRNDRKKLKSLATSRESTITISTDDQEIVGSPAGHIKIKPHHNHIDFHGRLKPRYNTINEAYTTCSCSNPSYMDYNGNGETTNNLAFTQIGVQQPVQVYQLMPVQDNYSQTSECRLVPEMHSNPIVQYSSGYPTGLPRVYYL